MPECGRNGACRGQRRVQIFRSRRNDRLDATSALKIALTPHCRAIARSLFLIVLRTRAESERLQLFLGADIICNSVKIQFFHNTKPPRLVFCLATISKHYLQFCITHFGRISYCIQKNRRNYDQDHLYQSAQDRQSGAEAHCQKALIHLRARKLSRVCSRATFCLCAVHSAQKGTLDILLAQLSVLRYGLKDKKSPSTEGQICI